MLNMEEENKFMEKIHANLRNAMGINISAEPLEGEEIKQKKIEDLIW